MIYIHIPFCASHCTYCAFYSELLRPCTRGSEGVSSSGGGMDSSLERYAEAVEREIDACFRESPGIGNAEKAGTLYFGGGTPSLLSTACVAHLTEAVRKYADITEFTFELNPDDLVAKGLDYATGLRRAGVNRISMGVQSFDDPVLKRMGRRHRNAQTLKAYSLLREAGFTNISLDFIFGFQKGDEVGHLRTGLEGLSSLTLADGLSRAGLPEHISCYQLSVEEGSGLKKMLDRGLWNLPSDDECADRYYRICSLLSDLGYEHYETSNFCLPGFRSVHNSGYWTHEPYYGFGPGAHSLVLEGSPARYIRRWNRPDLKAYLDNWLGDAVWTRPSENVGGWEVLTAAQLREERIMLGLRTAEGVDEVVLRDADGGVSLERALSEGKLERVGTSRLRIPGDRCFICDRIICDLI